MTLITPRTGNIFLRTGQGVIAPPAGGGLVVLPGGGSGTALAGTLAAFAGTGSGLASVSFIMRVRAAEIIAAMAPGATISSVGIGYVSDGFELGIVSPSAGNFGLTATAQDGFVNGTNSGPYAVSLLRTTSGFLWVYAFMDSTVSGGAMGYYLFSDSGTQLAGATRTGIGSERVGPADLNFGIGLYLNAPIATYPGGIVVDGFGVFGDPVVSAQLSGSARYSPPIPYGVGGSPPLLLVSYGFSSVLTPDQPAVVAPLVPTAPNGGTPSVSFIPGGIFN